VINTFIKKDIH